MTQGGLRSITTILYDLDGTLVDSRHDIAMAFQYAWQTIVGGLPPDIDAIAQHIGKPLAEMLCEVGVALSPSMLNDFLAAYRHRYAEQDACFTRPYPEVIATLGALSSHTFGIVTTKEQGQAEMVLRRLGLTPFFRHVQGWTPGLRLKPAPDSILAALGALECAPSDALMVGDTPADILAGKAAGVTTCAVTYGFGTRQALSQCAPDYMIDTFDELVPLLLESKGRDSSPSGAGFSTPA